MENQVIMPLEDYTKLITENALLKDKMKSFKHKAEIKLEDNVKSHFINTLSKETVVSYLGEKNKEKVINDLSSYNSSWYWESLASEILVITPEEAKEMAYAIIIKCLELRLDDINNQKE